MFRSSLTGLLLLFVTAVGACVGPTKPSPPLVDFIVSVANERFVLRTADPETIRLAEENQRGVNARFPLGPLRAGDGGFNQPWKWHLDPAATRFVDIAVGVCDALPSHVESRLGELTSYCPQGAKVVGRR